jgi:hypothetical protein
VLQQNLKSYEVIPPIGWAISLAMFARTYMPSFVQVACASSSIESSPNGSSIGFKPSTRKNDRLQYHEGIITLLKMVIAMVE